MPKYTHTHQQQHLHTYSLHLWELRSRSVQTCGHIRSWRFRASTSRIQSIYLFCSTSSVRDSRLFQVRRSYTLKSACVAEPASSCLVGVRINNNSVFSIYKTKHDPRLLHPSPNNTSTRPTETYYKVSLEIVLLLTIFRICSFPLNVCSFLFVKTPCVVWLIRRGWQEGIFCIQREESSSWWC